MTSLSFKKITVLIIILFLFSIAISRVIPSRLFFLGGEYIFSFDYFIHVQNIVFDYSQSSIHENNTTCNNCPDFYHYSRWYSLFKIGLQLFGEILSLHPAIFLILSSVAFQLFGLYVLTRTFQKQVLTIPFFIAAFFNIVAPYKYSLTIETHDGTLYGTTLLLFSCLVIVIRNIKNRKTSKFIQLSIAFSLLFSTYFNINIAFFPLVFYMLIITLLFHLRLIIKYWKNTILFVVILLFISMIINIPFFISLYEYGVTRHYVDYFSFNAVDSFFLGIGLAGADKIFIYIYSLLLFIIVSLTKIKTRHKIALLGIYFLTGIMLMGENGIINIYNIIFTRLPLFDAMRSNYRLFVIQFTIIYIFSYMFLVNLVRKPTACIFFSLSMIILPIIHILHNSNYLLTKQLPVEYFTLQSYLNSQNKRSIYLPLASYGTKSIANNYTWSDPLYQNSIVIYKNPFTSILPLKNHVQFEKYPLLSPELLDLNASLNNYSSVEIVSKLNRANIDFIVLDYNYLWETEQLQRAERIIEHLSFFRSYGSLQLFAVPSQISKCTKAYGDFLPNTCFDYSDPSQLINRTKQEYLIETQIHKYHHDEMKLNKEKKYYFNILDPEEQNQILSKSLLISNLPIQMNSQQEGVFVSKKHDVGNYIVFVSVLQLHTGTENVVPSFSVILPDGTKKVVATETLCSGIKWYKIPFNLTQPESSIKINIEAGFSHITFNQKPFITTQQEYERLKEDASRIDVESYTDCR